MATDAGLPARAAALSILDAVLTGQRPLEQALAASSGLETLSGSDRAFVRLLLGTTLRRLGEIDATLDRHLHKPLAPQALGVRHILRLGTAQLVFLATPPHAAVDTSVKLAKASGLGGFAGLINAILRRVVGTVSLEGYDAARSNTPGWLWKGWIDAYGQATTGMIGEAHLREAPLDLTLKDGAGLDLQTIQATRMPTGSLRCYGTGNPTDLPGFADGAYWVQDAAAALPARLIPGPSGKRVIDLCAAPGGKSAQLAAAGAQVTAVERSSQRLQLLARNLRRLRLNAKTVVADAIDWRPDQKADAVLLDAPCTATGTIRRHPDILHLKRPEDPSRLAQSQSRLLDAAAEMVHPGGHLVYAVCSLQPEEGPKVVEAFLARDKRFSRDAVTRDELPGIDTFITAEGDLRTLPCHWAELGGIDGFFAVRLRHG